MTYLDVLAFRMRNSAIQEAIETLMTGAVNIDLPESERFRLCLDLGLIAIEKGSPIVGNPIYREILARYMTYGPQLAIPEPEFRRENPNGYGVDGTLITPLPKGGGFLLRRYTPGA